MQAAIGHPLTVHGTGGQTRAFIHIKDTAACVEIAISHPPKAGDRPMVLNQVTETHRVIDLAKLVADTTGGEIAFLPNPRVGAEENELAVRNDHFLALGLTPTTLSEGLLTEVRDVAARYAHRADPRKIISRSVWRAGMPCASDLLPARLPSTDSRGGPPLKLTAISRRQRRRSWSPVKQERSPVCEVAGPDCRAAASACAAVMPSGSPAIAAAKARKMGQSAPADKATDFAIGDTPGPRPGGTGKEIIQVVAPRAAFVRAGGAEEIVVFAIRPPARTSGLRGPSPGRKPRDE
jgi:hypothetical protein